MKNIIKSWLGITKVERSLQKVFKKEEKKSTSGGFYDFWSFRLYDYFNGFKTNRTLEERTESLEERVQRLTEYLNLEEVDETTVPKHFKVKAKRPVGRPRKNPSPRA